MKNLLLMVAASALMFACSDEKENSNVPDQGVVFELAAVNEPQNTMTTRSRPLYSQDAVQEIEEVQILVFKKNGLDYTYNKTYTPSWSKGTSFQRFTVPDNDKLVAGDYQFLVIGQEANNNYTFFQPITGTTQMQNITATIAAPGNETEFFAGNKNVTVSSEGVRVNIDMTRKIAGVLGYFKNVPAQIGGNTVKYLRVTVSSTENSVLVYNGAGTGTVSNTPYNIIDVDLTSQTITAEGVYSGNDLSSKGVAKVVNSQLFGKFILPVNTITMTVGLYGDGVDPLKIWQVLDNGNSTFNLTANHFYALGQKVSKNDTTGGGTPNPGDDDAPIDLLKDQVIAITVDANWNSVHNLFIQ